MRIAEARLLDREWSFIAPIFRRRKQAGGRPSDDRRLLDAMLYVAWSRSSWRRLPAKYGNANSVARAFARWCEQGAVDELLNWAVPLCSEDDDPDLTAIALHGRLRALGELQYRYWRGKR